MPSILEQLIKQVKIQQRLQSALFALRLTCQQQLFKWHHQLYLVGWQPNRLCDIGIWLRSFRRWLCRLFHHCLLRQQLLIDVQSDKRHYSLSHSIKESYTCIIRRCSFLYIATIVSKTLHEVRGSYDNRLINSDILPLMLFLKGFNKFRRRLNLIE